MVVCKQKIIKASYISLGFTVVLLFQNCGKSVFLIEALGSGSKNSAEAVQVIDADCASIYGCQTASSPESQADASGNESSINTPNLPVATPNPPDKNALIMQDRFAYDMPIALLNTPALEKAQSKKMQELFYNFVADSKDVCEASIKLKLGVESTCYVGAGCGTGCGQPNSSCFSANPDKWGACIHE